MLELLGLALSTFLSEDLALLAGGALVAAGRHSFPATVLACMSGIFVGDLLLYLAGRFGAKWVERRVQASRLEAASHWLNEQGAWVVLASRFLPGTRLPTYVAAGMLRVNAWRFGLYLAIAASIWTPLIIGGAAHGGWLWTGGILAAVLLLRRVPRWEFWPPWAVYLPLLPYFAYLAIRHRSLTLFTLANPGIPTGGTVGESKAEILRQLDASRTGRFLFFGHNMSVDARLERCRHFMRQHGIPYPVVLKPDRGERGNGVAIVRSEIELRQLLEQQQEAMLLQEYIAGNEFGVFYARLPHERQGRILSITEKRFPEVVGDGVRTLRQLILADPRARQISAVYLTRLQRRAGEVPPAGERVQLVEIGSHSKGAVFLDGRRLETPALAAAIDAVSRPFAGFHLGRYDLRAPSVQVLQAGEFKVLELNGVTAEPTHIYDPAVGLGEAYRTLAKQWELAFAIGGWYRSQGLRPTPWRELLWLARRRAPLAETAMGHEVLSPALK